MRRWQSKIDEAIQKFVRGGDSSDLPGAGKPLNLNEDPNVPDDMRMAYRIMAENEVVPEWIALGKSLEKKEADIRARLARAVKEYRTTRQVDYRERAWQATLGALKRLVKDYNDEVLTYNLKVPPSVRHRLFFDLDQAITEAFSGGA